MIDEKDKQLAPEASDEIDLLELIQKVWADRWLLLKACGVAVVLGLIVAFSIPKEYNSTVVLAPEVESKGGSSLGALAAMAGVNINTSSGGDVLSPDLYPDIIQSTPFLMNLFEVPVSYKGDSIRLYDYLLDKQKKAWWSSVLALPGKAVGGLLSLFRGQTDENAVELADSRVLYLSEEDVQVIRSLSAQLHVSIDKKTGVTTISAQMQDPKIAAAVVDTVKGSLQSYITEYRTNKARQDLAFTENLYKEAKQKYFEAQATYANYMDGNQNVVLQRFRTEQERLQNEMNLTYGIYNQVAQQLQMAKARVQEITPVYTVLQPAQVPLQASKPSKMLILVGFVFLAVVVSVGWSMLGRDFLASFRKQV